VQSQVENSYAVKSEIEIRISRKRATRSQIEHFAPRSHSDSKR